jgi:hypothetical protein
MPQKTPSSPMPKQTGAQPKPSGGSKANPPAAAPVKGAPPNTKKK